MSAASASYADPLTCNLTDYKAVPGLTASVGGNALAVAWEGDNGAELRMRLGIERGTPTIRELAVRKKGGQWSTLATNVTPEFRVVSGLRRATQQQTQPLERLGVALTPEVIDKIKWEAFWDAPLYIEGSGELPPTHQTSIPPMKGVANQPGLPRKPEEVKRATATYNVQGCEVKTNGARLEISFPGVTAGVFTTGRLQYDVFKGSNLIRQVVIAKTDLPSVAYKYDGGLKGLPIQADITRRLARPRRPLAGPAIWRSDQQGLGRRVEQQPPDRRRAAGRLDCRVPAAAQLLRRARIESGPRRQLLPQGQRHIVLVRHPAGREGRGPGVPP